MNWTAVEDALPEVPDSEWSVDILVYHAATGSTHRAVFRVLPGGFYEDGYETQAVTHWQYLPETARERE